jgi:acetolactate synthase-1/2/3 large subunit
MIESLNRATNGEAIVTSDVGQHQMWVAQYYDFPQPRRWINSGGLGTMGVGLPFAIGAKIACPQETVVCVTGDGSLIMTVQELATAVSNDVPVKVLLMNNGHYGMVRQWQELFWDSKHVAIEMGESPDWVKLADAFGCAAARVDDKADLDQAISDTLAEEGPALLDVRVDPTENCYPMIPAGAAARDMVG